MTRVLVCGGRDYRDQMRVNDTLHALHHESPITLLIHGGAHGADWLGASWAKSWGIAVQECVAKWQQYGKGAGPRRNQEMLDVHRPDLVVAFPGGIGTADMTRRAKAAGVPVVEVSP